MGKIQNKEQIIHKAEQEKKRKKAKSGRPNNNALTYVDPANSPDTSITTSMSGLYKEGQWEKIFGSKNKSKDTDKKT